MQSTTVPKPKALMTRPRDITTYHTIVEVKRAIPSDPENEELRLQYVFPNINGIAYPEAAAYRFIRYSTKEGRLKSQMGQAQVADLKIMIELIIEMAGKRSLKNILKMFK